MNGTSRPESGSPRPSPAEHDTREVGALSYALGDPAPAFAGLWQYVALASSRMREHERRRKARWRATA